MTRTQPHHRLGMLALGLLAIGLLTFATAPRADAATVIVNHDASVVLEDSDNDGDGDSVVTASAFRIGESGADSGNEWRLYAAFDPDASERAMIAATGTTITLDFGLINKFNVTGLNVDIYGLGNRTTTIPVVGDHEAAAGSPLVASALTPASDAGAYSFDVTSFVKDQVDLGSSNVIVFRLQMDSDAWPTDDGKASNYRLDSGSDGEADFTLTITTIPEPATLALLAPAGLMLLRRRRGD